MGSRTEQIRSHNQVDDTRREFIRGSSLLLASALPATQLPRPLRIGLLGCGSSGVKLASFALASAVPSELVAIADLKQSSLAQATRTLKSRFGSQFVVEEKLCGATAARELASTRLDVVIVATPLPVKSKHVGFMFAKNTACYAEAPLVETPRQLEEIQHTSQQMLGLGSRCPWNYRFALPEAVAQAGRLQTFRFQESLRGGAGQSEVLLRARIQHFQLALSSCYQANLPIQVREIELLECQVGQASHYAKFNLGCGIVLSSLLEWSSDARSSFEMVGTNGKFDLSRGRGWDSTGQAAWRLSPLKSAKDARQRQIEEFLAAVAAKERTNLSVNESFYLNQLALDSFQTATEKRMHDGAEA